MPLAATILEQEARALLTRLARVQPLALHEPMVPAAAISMPAQRAIETMLTRGRRELREMVHAYLAWIRGPGREASAVELQRRFTLIRLRFNTVLSQFDLFVDVLTQRSEHHTGVWLGGLDAAAADALALPGGYYDPPPVVCYLDRGPGAAIRRARTRIPGDVPNPVAIVQVPRERMVGTGIASSLVHEVGHQGAALLDLVTSLHPVLVGLQNRGGSDAIAWQLWRRWLSEILADGWSVARVGVASTLGLIGVLSLPAAFVFRLNTDDPHPVPWIRVKLSCALGNALYPHPQWTRLAALWEALYPLDAVDAERRRLFDLLQRTIPALVAVIVHHRPRRLRGDSLMEAMGVQERQPARLLAYDRAWQARPDAMAAAAPSLAFAVLGQARAAGTLTPEEESILVSRLLVQWAVRAATGTPPASRPGERLMTVA